MELTPNLEHQLRGLPQKRRRVVVDGLNSFARGLLEQSAASGDLQKVETASRAALDALEVLMSASPELLARLTDVLAELRTESEAAEMDLAELKASGRLQVVASYRAVEAESLSVAELEAAGIQRQRLQQLRDQDRLLGIRLPFQRGFLYPRWQFGDDLRPGRYLPELLAAARQAGLDALTVHRVMTRPTADGDRTLVDLCQQGAIEPALYALRNVGELGG